MTLQNIHRILEYKRDEVASVSGPMLDSIPQFSRLLGMYDKTHIELLFK